MTMDIRASIKNIALTLAAQVLWVIGVAVSTSILVFLFGTTSLDKILRRQISVPAWTILLAAVLVLIFSVDAVRRGAPHEELRSLYRRELGGMP